MKAIKTKSFEEARRAQEVYDQKQAVTKTIDCEKLNALLDREVNECEKLAMKADREMDWTTYHFWMARKAAVSNIQWQIRMM